jgi:hypothetical protein
MTIFGIAGDLSTWSNGGILSNYFVDRLNWIALHLAWLVVAMVGSAISHIFFRLPQTNIRPFLRTIFPARGDATIETLQFLIIVFTGGFTAMFLLQPQGSTPAFLGGFSWFATLNQIAKRRSK